MVLPNWASVWGMNNEMRIGNDYSNCPHDQLLLVSLSVFILRNKSKFLENRAENYSKVIKYWLKVLNYSLKFFLLLSIVN